MTIERKLLSTSPSGDAPNVAEVFSTDLFNIGNANLRIRNGINLSDEGGMVWFASRAEQKSPNITDTERGAGYRLRPFSNYNANGSVATSEVVTQFRTNGFNYGDAYNSSSAVTWTFRKAPKFFDIVTWTGNDVAGRQISHSLGSAPAMIITKVTTTTADWKVYHSALGNAKSLKLNQTTAQAGASVWNSTTPTSTVFTVGSDGDINSSGRTYVAYLFADNSSELADNQMIKCGSYTGNGTLNGGPEINLGWEPQFVMIKCASAAAGWYMYDSMRGIVTGGSDSYIYANADAGENTTTGMNLQPTGFQITGNTVGENGSGQTYIYMAIRAPMMKEEESRTELFSTQAYTGGGVGPSPGFVTDFSLLGQLSGSDKFYTSARLSGSKTLNTRISNAESDQGSQLPWDRMDGNWNTTISGYSYWGWKRSKGFMDVVAYKGNATANRAIPHSLGVVPEMVWIKGRSYGFGWQVKHKDVTNALALNGNYGAIFGQRISNLSSTTFTVSDIDTVNDGSNTYIAYMWATLPGISKVGSYTGNGSSQTVPCGFSNGAMFILIKRTDASGDWYIWDSVRGIVAGNDPHVSLNTTAAQVTNNDSVDPANAGFIVNQVSATNINVSSATYIFYAIRS